LLLPGFRRGADTLQREAPAGRLVTQEVTLNPQGPAGRDPDPREAPPEDIEEIDLDRATWDAAYRRRVLRRIRPTEQDVGDRQTSDDNSV